MTGWYVGTMGFSYMDWNSVFYPTKMEARNYLSYYSRIFNCVEIDSTFYGMPKEEIVQRWAAVTPPGFKFCLKVPRAITHEAGLLNVHAALAEFLRVVRQLHDRLGVILIQLPPTFAANQLAVLEDFVRLLPPDLKFAVEIRHQSWYTASAEADLPLLAQMLKTYRVCWAATEYPGLPGKIFLTSDFLYIRWIGQHGAFERHDRVRLDRASNLLAWWQQIQTYLENVQDIYGLLNNDYAGFAAQTANHLKALVGLPVKDFRPPIQKILF